MKLLFAILLYVAALPAFSATSSGVMQIASVEVTEAFFTVYFANGPAKSDDCQQSDKVVFWRTDYPHGYSTMLSTALAAFSANKKVSMWLNSCKIGPWGPTLPKAESIVITHL